MRLAPPSPDPSAWPACRCLRAFSGMGTPDLPGTYGTFTLFTDGPYRVPPTVEGAGAELVAGAGLEVPGGWIASVRLDGGQARISIPGPQLEGRPRAAEGRLHVDRSSRSVHLELGGEDLVLTGEEAVGDRLQGAVLHQRREAGEPAGGRLRHLRLCE